MASAAIPHATSDHVRTFRDEGYLVLERVLPRRQYFVKAAEQGLKFGWHQDSGYIPMRAC